MRETEARPAARPSVAMLASVVFVAALAPAFAPRVGLAVEPGLGSEFEPVGTTTGENGLASRVRHIPTGVILVLIPSGRAVVGSPETEAKRDGDEPQRAESIPAAFYLGETEVTIAQWQSVMSEVPDDIKFAERADLPVGAVSWYAAQEFVRRLNARGEGGWRLPSEIEWEYACRAGSTTPFSFGADVSTRQVNFNGSRPYAGSEPGEYRKRLLPVRSLPPNGWGLYEIHGNAWEWCEDVYVVRPELASAASDASGAPRVIRGGSYSARADMVRSANRDGIPPSSDFPEHGFRVVKTVVR